MSYDFLQHLLKTNPKAFGLAVRQMALEYYLSKDNKHRKLPLEAIKLEIVKTVMSHITDERVMQ